MPLSESEGEFPLLHSCSEVLGQSGDNDLTIPEVSRFVEFQRDGPSRMVYSSSNRIGVYRTRGGRAVAVKDIKAQLGAARERTGSIDHAAVATHLDGI